MPPKSKPGEGIIVVIDVGPSVRESTETTFYSQAKTCLISILQRKIFADKCKDMVGIVLFGTDRTRNNLASGNQYQHITVLQTPKFVDWGLVQLAEQLPRGNCQGDWLDAIIVTMDLFHDDPGGVMFGAKKIVLMTDFNGSFSDDQVSTIVQGLTDMNIELSVIGPTLGDDDDDMDANDSGPSTSKPKASAILNWNGKPKRPSQLAAEALIRRIVAEVDGMICSFDEAIPQLLFFEKKSQTSANWNAMLDIGPHLKVPVVGKIKVKRAMRPPWRKCHVEDESAAILSETSHHKMDEKRTPVQQEDIIAGYKYGTTLVPFGSEDSQHLSYTCPQQSSSLSVLGFTRSVNVPPTIRAGDQVLVLTARDGDEDGAVALSALTQALSELDMVAVTRRVYRKGSKPILGALFPDITTDYECLIWVGLPFQEEFRSFGFPSLTKVEKRISDEQRDAMDSFITAMDLSANGDEEEESLDPTVVVNPELQHFFNCLTHRALCPDDPLPAPHQHVLDILSPPQERREARDAMADKFKRLFPTQEVLNYKKKKENIFDRPDDLSASTSAVPGGVVTSRDIAVNVVFKISTASPAQDFLTMLQAENPRYQEICNEMTDVLLRMCECLSTDAMSDRLLTEKIISSMRTFRQETTAINPMPYNIFLRHLKPLVEARKLTDLWLVVSQDNLGLITSSESMRSFVTSDEAAEFLQTTDDGDREVVRPPAPQQAPQDIDDLLDDL